MPVTFSSEGFALDDSLEPTVIEALQPVDIQRGIVRGDQGNFTTWSLKFQ